jgi:hypothetical protein
VCGGAFFQSKAAQRREGGLILSTPARIPDAAIEVASPPPQLATLGWAVRRAALGLLILFVMVVLGAWLFYASIDVDEAAASDSAPPAAESAPPRR